MKKLLIIPVIFVTTLAACDNAADDSRGANSSQTSTEKDSLPESVSFTGFTHNFVSEFQLDSAGVTRFAHPDLGIYVLDNPGAFHIATHTFDYSFMNTREWSEGFNCLPEHAGIPVYSCENNSWSNEGCYYDVQSAPVVTPLQELMVEYELTDSFDRKRASEFDETIEYELRGTDQFVGFYFGRVEGEWYLLAIDLIVPCSA